jgi:hypothetical protein
MIVFKPFILPLLLTTAMWGKQADSSITPTCRIRQMTQKRPPHVKAPAYLSPNKPVPQPEEVTIEPESGREGPDPTRYGDWEKKGIAIDF